MKSLRKWLANRRWRKQQAPREGWLLMIDERGTVVAKRPATLVPTEHGKFANDAPLDFIDMPPAHVVSLRFVDADGNEFDGTPTF